MVDLIIATQKVQIRKKIQIMEILQWGRMRIEMC